MAAWLEARADAAPQAAEASGFTPRPSLPFVPPINFQDLSSAVFENFARTVEAIRVAAAVASAAAMATPLYPPWRDAGCRHAPCAAAIASWWRMHFPRGAARHAPPLTEPSTRRCVRLTARPCCARSSSPGRRPSAMSPHGTWPTTGLCIRALTPPRCLSGRPRFATTSIA